MVGIPPAITTSPGVRRGAPLTGLVVDGGTPLITLNKQAHPPNPRQERKKERRPNMVELPQPDPDTPRVEFLSTI